MKPEKASDEELTLAEARECWSDWDLLSECKRLRAEARGGPIVIHSIYLHGASAERRNAENSLRAHRIRKANQACARVDANFKNRLVAGELVATGLEYPRKPKSRRLKIKPELWRRLALDFGTSSAEGDGLRLVDITVARPAKVRDPRQNASPVERERWYKKRAAEWPSSEPPPSRDDDVIAAKKKFGDRVTNRQIFDLRRKMAPDSWKRKGRRKSKIQPVVD